MQPSALLDTLLSNAAKDYLTDSKNEWWFYGGLEWLGRSVIRRWRCFRCQLGNHLVVAGGNSNLMLEHLAALLCLPAHPRLWQQAPQWHFDDVPSCRWCRCPRLGGGLCWLGLAGQVPSPPSGRGMRWEKGTQLAIKDAVDAAVNSP